MMNVVFTGPAAFGNQVVYRRVLEEACEKRGNIRVQKSVNADTNFLVASRIDTVKAQRAVESGIAVLDYEDFIGKFLAGIEFANAGEPHPIVDKFPKFGSLEEADIL